jgi:hypothetical protein
LAISVPFSSRNIPITNRSWNEADSCKTLAILLPTPTPPTRCYERTDTWCGFVKWILSYSMRNAKVAFPFT